MAAYCSLQDIRTFSRDPEIDAGIISLLVGPISEAIDRFCRRSFATIRDVRYYDYGDRTIRLRHDLVELYEVTTSAGQSLDAADFTLGPRDSAPFQEISLKSSAGAFTYADTPDKAIGVDALWGYGEEVPGPVKLAAIFWVMEIYAHSDTWGYRSVSGGGVEATLTEMVDAPPAPVQALLRPYRRVRIEALA